MMGRMARKPVAREAVLDAFESLLIEEGERAATLDAVARLAGVSKGGLLYHFPTKEAMISVLLERLDRLLAEDLAALNARLRQRGLREVVVTPAGRLRM